MKYKIFPALFFLFFVLVLFSCTNYGTRLPFKAGELYYTQNVTEQEAKRVGDYLTSISFFDDKNQISLQLDKEGSTYLLKMCTKKEFQTDTSRDAAISLVGAMVSSSALDNKPVDFYLTDQTFKTIRILKYKPLEPPIEPEARKN